MRQLLLSLFIILQTFTIFSQTVVKRPKLVVGIVVDQMRWDYLYRYSDKYAANGGFKRLLTQGFSCENTMIPYTPTITACGHTCIYTGSVPAIHGIVGNNWYDNDLLKTVYCTEDKSVTTVGSPTAAGEMSPQNLLTTTITDELRLATNFKSKVIGIAIKDRGAILPAGHSANGTYWYDGVVGKWITSTYYQKELPEWVKKFNEKEWVPAGKNYDIIKATPLGNTITLQLAREAINEEKMGNMGTTDFLAVSLSSPDYIGHAHGPNSVEAEDNYIKLDKELASFLDFLDNKIGKGEYLLFLSADHGVAHVPEFMKENKLPGGRLDDMAWLTTMNKELFKKYKKNVIISNLLNYQVYLNHPLLDSANLDKEEITNWIINYLSKQQGVARAFKLTDLFTTTLNAKMKDMLTNGYYPKRSGDIQIIFQPNWIDVGPPGTTHGLWNPYDAHIPLVWYGWMVKPGKTNREIYMTDITPTIAALLHIQMPNGCIGKVIEEIKR